MTLAKARAYDATRFNGAGFVITQKILRASEGHSESHGKYIYIAAISPATRYTVAQDERAP